jgi:sigma-E factor negative regulatory protein RseB
LRGGALSALVLLLASAPTRAQPPPDWLDRMLRAGDQMHYGGAIVYTQAQSVSAMRLVHVGAPEGPLDRVQTLDGGYWELRRNVLGAQLLVPGDIPVGGIAVCPLGGNFAVEVPRRLKAVRGLYRLNEAGKSRVAGRVVQQIEAVPADPYRYGVRLAIDEDAGLLLRATLLGPNGVPVEQVFFTAVEYADTPQARARGIALANEPPPPGLVAFPLSSEQSASAWEARWLPPGFALRRRMLDDTGPAPTEQLLYSDGLAALSVFIEPHDPATPPLTGPVQLGTANAFGTVYPGYRVVVIGAVPEATLRLVSENLAPAGPAIH